MLPAESVLRVQNVGVLEAFDAQDGLRFIEIHCIPSAVVEGTVHNLFVLLNAAAKKLT